MRANLAVRPSMAHVGVEGTAAEESLEAGASANGAEAHASEDGRRNSTSAEARRVMSNLASGISQHMSYFLANELSVANQESIRRTYIVAALERHGVSLERQLQWFALRTVKESGLFEHAVEVHESSSTKVDNRSEGNVNRRPDNGPPTTQKDEDAVLDAVLDAHYGPKRKRSFWGEIKTKVAEVAEDHVAGNLLDKTRIAAFFEAGVEDVASINTEELAKDIAAFREIDADTSKANAQQEIDTVLQRESGTQKAPSSRTDPAAYRAWKRAQPHKRSQFVQKLFDALRKQADGLNQDKELLPKMKATLEQVYTINDKLANIRAIIEAANHVDWETVKAYKEKKGWAAFKEFLQPVGEHFKTTWENTKKLRNRIFNRFRSMISEKDIQCTKEHQESEKRAMQDAGMESKEDMAAYFNMKTKKDMPSESELNSKLEDQMTKAGRVLKAKEEAGQQHTAHLEALMVGLTASGTKMEEESQAGTLLQTTVDEVGAKADEVADTACGEKEWWIVSKLQGLLQGLKATEDAVIPTLGIRGIGGAASVIAGGFEEVIDFWNKEIGVFTWGAAWAGMNSATAGVGGYAGVGWKGYKLDWNLEEAYQTAMYTTAGWNLGIPAIASLGASVTTALDADNSQGLPWVPEPNGCNGLVIGWGVSAGPSLPIGVDMGQAKYKMFTSECFGADEKGEFMDDFWGLMKFIGMIWLPHCLRCEGIAETVTMDTLRLAIHAASYPGLTDLIHSMLALRVHYIRKGSKVPHCRQDNGTWAACENSTYDASLPEADRCSLRSTSQRDNPIRIFEIVSKKLTESTEILDEIVESYDSLLTKVDEAQDVNTEVWTSKEMEDFVKSMKSNSVGCLQAPQEKTMTMASGSIVKERYFGDNFKSRSTVLNACRLKHYCAKHLHWTSSTPTDRIRQLLQRANQVATKKKPFGRCSKHAMCHDYRSSFADQLRSRNETTFAERKEMLTCRCQYVSFAECVALMGVNDCHRVCPGLSGTCSCAEGWCYSPDHICVKDEGTPSKMGLEGLKHSLLNWVRAREFEIGSAARYLKTLSKVPETTSDLGILATEEATS